MSLQESKTDSQTFNSSLERAMAEIDRIEKMRAAMQVCGVDPDLIEQAIESAKSSADLFGRHDCAMVVARAWTPTQAGVIFDKDFWPAYPEREGNNPKKPAREKFVRKVISGENPNDMVAGARRLAEYHQAKGDVG